MAIWSGPIIRLFSSDPEVVALGTQTLFIAAATELFFSFFVIACGICRGAGDVRFSLLVSVIGMWGLRIGLVYLATRPLAVHLPPADGGGRRVDCDCRGLLHPHNFMHLEA